MTRLRRYWPLAVACLAMAGAGAVVSRLALGWWPAWAGG